MLAVTGSSRRVVGFLQVPGAVVGVAASRRRALGALVLKCAKVVFDSRYACLRCLPNHVADQFDLFITFGVIAEHKVGDAFTVDVKVGHR